MTSLAVMFVRTGNDTLCIKTYISVAGGAKAMF